MTTSEPELPSPLTIGPFRLESVLGRGGMGVVYRASDPGGRAVAVKILQTQQAPASIVRRFQREAAIRVDHPNVIEVIDAGTAADGTSWIALELLEGADVARLLLGPALKFSQIVDVGVQVCAGLEALHALGIVHRDLKPGNLFRCIDGTIKILDFGIALLDTKETRLTGGSGVIGTPAYLSPEQARGHPDIDRRTDIWALGAVLYEMLSGRPPFQAETALATVVAVVTDDLVPLWLRAPGVPRSLTDVVDRALCKPRAERWSSAAEMAAALRAVDLGVEATTAPRGPALVDRSAPTTITRHTPTLSLSGEKRVVAVLLAEEVSDPAAIERAVVERGGVHLPLLHERSIGVFGGESWEGDEAVRAVAAALYARAAARRMAVAAGRAMLTSAGISGAVLSAAERGCAAALAGVAVDAQTGQALHGAFRILPAESGLLEVSGELPPTWPAIGTADGDRPLLGRDPEVAQMRAALEAALDEGSAVTVLVVGPAGIGKTRLRQEMERLLDAFPERIWLTGQSLPATRGTSLSLFRSALEGRARLGALLRGWPRITDGASGEERRAAVRALAHEACTDDAAAEECASFLGELLGVVMDRSPTLLAAEGDGHLMADRIRLALFDYFEGLSRRGPVALLVEDLQWADDASIEMLRDLVDRMSSLPLLLFATARPELEESHPDAFEERGGALRRVVLHGLPSGDVARIAENVLGRRLPASLVRRIAEGTGGNPFFVEQIAMALRDSGLGEDELLDLPLPVTVEATIQSRLDHLAPAEKELAKRASVFGRPLSVEEARVLGVAGPRELLAALCRRDVMATRVRTKQGERDYQFKSPLVAEVAYRMLADDQREDLHRRAARHLDEVAGGSLEEVASHYERGALPAEAAARYAAAALAAARRGDGPTVLRCSDRSLALGAPSAHCFALRMVRADALRFLGRRGEQEGEIEAALESASTDAERARALVERVGWLRRAGRSKDALGVADQAVRTAEACGDREVLSLAMARHAAAMVDAGRTTGVRDVLGQARALADEASPQVRADIAALSAEVAGGLGDLGGRLSGYVDAVRLYRECGDVRRAAVAEGNLADACNRLGSYAEAEAALRSALEGCRRIGGRVMEAYALANLGYSLTMLDRGEEALSVLAGSARLAESTRDARLGVVVLLYRSRALVRQGRTDEALAEAEAATSEASRLRMTAIGALALSVAARAMLARGDAAGALERSARAMSLRDEIGSVEEDEAEIFLVHARSLAACGRIAEARDVVQRGRRRIVEIADGLSDPEWRARFLGAVEAHRELMRDDP